MYRLIGSIHTLTGLPGAISEFLRAMDSVRKSVAVEASLSANELRAMALIAETDDATPKLLALELELTSGAITAITNGLVARGLIVRTEHANDRRSLLLRLTAEGHRVMEHAYEQFQDALALSAQPLPTELKANLVDGLTMMTAHFRGGED